MKTNDSNVPPKDGARAWASCASFFFMTFVVIGNARLLGMFFEEWKLEFGIPRSQSSWTTATAFFMVGIGGPFSSFLLGFFSPMTLLFFSGLISSLGFIIIFFAKSFPVLVIMNMLTFTGGGISIFTTYITVGQWSEKYRPTMIGLANLGSPLAGMILPRFFEFLKNEYSWRGVFLIAGGFFLNICVAAIPLRKYPIKQANEKNGIMETGAKKIQRYDLSIFRLPLFQMLVFYCLLHTGCMFGIVGFHPSMANELGLNDTDKSYILICLGTSDMISRFIMSFILTIPKLRSHLSKFLLLNEILMGLASLWIGLSNNFGTLVGASILFGFTYSVWTVCFLSYLVELTMPRQIPVAVGTVGLINAISSLLLPPFAGFIADSTNKYETVFFVFASLLFMSPICLFFVVFLQQKRDEYRERVNKIAFGFITTLSLKSDLDKK